MRGQEDLFGQGWQPQELPFKEDRPELVEEFRQLAEDSADLRSGLNWREFNDSDMSMPLDEEHAADMLSVGRRRRGGREMLKNLGTAMLESSKIRRVPGPPSQGEL